MASFDAFLVVFYSI